MDQTDRPREQGEGNTNPEPRKRLPPDDWAFLVGYVLLLPLFLAPLFRTHFLPGRDWPRHLSLVAMLAKPDAAAATFGAFYETDLRLAPHTLPYQVLVWLGQALSLVNAHRVLMALYVAALPLGAARLLSGCARSKLPALLAFPLAYNLAFHLGALSFVCALPLFLLMLGQIADNLNDDHDAEENVAPALVRDALLVGLAVLLFLCDLELYLLGLVVGAVFILLSGAPMVYRIRTSLTLLPSVVLLAWWQVAEYALHMQAPESGAGGPPMSTLRSLGSAVLKQRQSELALGSAAGLLGDLEQRLEALPQTLLLGFADNVHELAATVLCGALLLYMLGGTLSIFIRRGERAMARMATAGLLGLGVMLLLYLLLPEDLPQLGATLLYGRYAVLCGLFSLLLVPSWLLRMPRWALLLWLVPAVGPGAWYGMELLRHYFKYDTEIADFQAALGKVPAGGKLVGLVYAANSRVMAVPGAFSLLPEYYVAERGGLVAQPLCELPYMPCRPRDVSVLPPVAPRPDRFKLEPSMAYYDYFFTHAAPAPGRLFGRFVWQMEPAAQSGLWVVYRKRTAEQEPPPSGPALNVEQPAPRKTAAQKTRHRGSR